MSVSVASMVAGGMEWQAGGQGGEYYRCLLVFGMEGITKNRTLLLQMLLLNFSDGVGWGGTWTTTTTTTCYFCLYYCNSPLGWT